MNRTIVALLGAALAALALPAAAHHSFAVWDMTQNIEFKGVVDTLKFRNPHMAMTLTQTKADGTKETINFTEGAPAITVIGAPRKDDPNQYFIKAIVLKDGTRFQSIGP
jgi:hypothetical protein